MLQVCMVTPNADGQLFTKKLIINLTIQVKSIRANSTIQKGQVRESNSKKVVHRQKDMASSHHQLPSWKRAPTRSTVALRSNPFTYL